MYCACNGPSRFRSVAEFGLDSLIVLGLVYWPPVAWGALAGYVGLHVVDAVRAVRS